jgi:HEAT repeat protein
LRAVRENPGYGFPVHRIADVDSDDSTPALLSLIEDRKLSPYAWDAAAGILADLGERNAVELLIRALPDAEHRAAAADALATIGDARGADALRGFVSNQWARAVRSAAVRAQRAVFNLDTVTLLTGLLDDEEYDVRDASARALMEEIDRGELMDVLRAATGDASVVGRAHRLALLAEISGVEALSAILPLSQSEDSADRYAVVKGLDFISTPEATAELIRLAEFDDNEDVSYSAVEKLERRPDREIVASLSAVLLAHNSTLVRGRAAQALGRVADPAGIKPLCSALKGKERFSQYAAAALGALGAEDAIPALVDAWPEYEVSLSQEAIPRAIGRIGGRKAAQALSRLLAFEVNARRRRAIAVGLGEVKHPNAVPGLLLLGLVEEDFECRIIARAALCRLPPPVLRDGLIISLADMSPDVRRVAASIVAFYADEIIFPILLRLQENDDDSEVKRAARRAYEEVLLKEVRFDVLAQEEKDAQMAAI